MNEMLTNACELLKAGHSMAEKDPLFTKVMISEAINLIDRARFEESMEAKMEAGFERFLQDLHKKGFPL